MMIWIVLALDHDAMLKVHTSLDLPLDLVCVHIIIAHHIFIIIIINL